MDVISSLVAVLTNTTFLLALLVVTVCALLRHVFIDRSNGLPPGPRCRLPIIGNLYAVEPDMRKFLRRYRKKYGDIYSLYLGNKFVIIIAGYDKIKEAFLKNADVFSDRPKERDLISTITDGKGVVNVDGELWKEHRKFCLTTLRNLGMGKSILEQRIHSEIQILLQAFGSKENAAFNPEKLFLISVSNVMNSLSFGGHFKHDDPRFADMIKRMEENFSNIGFSGLGSFIPQLAYLPGDLFKIKKTLDNAKVVYEFLRTFVNEHLQDYDEDNIEDFTGAFIKEMKKQKTTEGKTTFTVEQLVHILGDFFVAGTESTATVLRWALVYLVNYPDLQEQIYNKIKNVVGVDRLPCLQDKPKLPIIEAFGQECLRHADILFTSLAHGTSRDVIFNGYLIPMRASILVDMHSVNSDPEIWKDPEVFRPQRFIDNDGLAYKPEEFVPFFIGRRSCLGESLARMELFLFLSAIIQNFKITAPLGEDLSLDNIDSFGLSHVPKPYNIVATPRGKLPF